MPLSLRRGWGASPSLSGQRSLSANYCRIPCWAAPTVPPTKSLANRNSMCGKRGVNLPAPGKHMVHFLLTIRSLLRLGVIVQSNKWWHLSKEAFSWDARTRKLWAFGLVSGWGRFRAFEEADNCRGQGAQRPGAARVATRHVRSKGHWKTGLQARPPLPTLITTTYKDKKRETEGQEGVVTYRENTGRQKTRESSTFFTPNTV